MVFGRFYNTLLKLSTQLQVVGTSSRFSKRQAQNCHILDWRDSSPPERETILTSYTKERDDATLYALLSFRRCVTTYDFRVDMDELHSIESH